MLPISFEQIFEFEACWFVGRHGLRQYLQGRADSLVHCISFTHLFQLLFYMFTILFIFDHIVCICVCIYCFRILNLVQEIECAFDLNPFALWQDADGEIEIHSVSCTKNVFSPCYRCRHCCAVEENIVQSFPRLSRLLDTVFEARSCKAPTVHQVQVWKKTLCMHVGSKHNPYWKIDVFRKVQVEVRGIVSQLEFATRFKDSVQKKHPHLKKLFKDDDNAIGMDIDEERLLSKFSELYRQSKGFRQMLCVRALHCVIQKLTTSKHIGAEKTFTEFAAAMSAMSPRLYAYFDRNFLQDFLPFAFIFSESHL